MLLTRLQNSPYFVYSGTHEQSNYLKVWSEAENGQQDWKEGHAGRVRLARLARVRLSLPLKNLLGEGGFCTRTSR